MTTDPADELAADSAKRSHAALFTPIARIVHVLICGIPIIVTFIGLFLPYFQIRTPDSAGTPISWATASQIQGSARPFISTLVFLALALVPLVLQFFDRKMPSNLLLGSSSFGLIAGGVALGNVAVNLEPGNIRWVEYNGFILERGIGFGLILAGAVGLIAAGMVLIARVWAAIRRREHILAQQ
ncbi:MULTISPECIES: hypothetical protein [unclassified Actinobaculum]|uniref:hypothetical protein n=1 Tax=unclassified Actinobaculum TaxID=2609299 RepID=UPI000D529BCC|nr:MULTISPECIES: hypothetical protein [unclassified Actinobaculum]AWE41802.1 hypothetical protein DDD63_02425 [Actinobaculum sp. 313]RTE50278.1 hypothetical protein EKN07_03470 [Actinobaculum sp. 352]